MLKTKWRTYTAFILLAEAVGILSGLLSREGIRAFSETVIQPPLSPPGWIFPVVWTALYALMGYGAARVYGKDGGSRALNFFIAQLIVNFFWSPLFFNAGAYGFAFFWLLLLLLLVAAMTCYFGKTDRKAALAQIPYIAWLLFAAYLNFGVWQLNR